MKRAPILAAFAAALALLIAPLTPTAPAAANATPTEQVQIPVGNGDFEQPSGGGIASWTSRPGAGATVALSPGAGRSGSAALTISANAGGGYSHAASERIAVEAGATYQVTAHVHMTGTRPLASVYTRFVDAAGKVLSSTFAGGGAAGQWNEVAHTATAPENAVGMFIWLYAGANAVGEHHFDDVTLTQSRPLTETVVINAGFEQLTAAGMPRGWTRAYGSAESFTIATDPVLSGTNSLRIHDTSTTSAQGLESTRFPVQAGQNYRAVVNLYRVSGTPSVYLRFYDAAGSLISSAANRMPTPTGQWSVGVGDGEAPVGAVTAAVLLYSAGSAVSETYYDDISITTAPVTTELIGAQHTTVNAFISAIGERADGTTVGYVATYGNPAQITEVDLTTGAALRSTTLPGAAGVWGLTVAPGGDVYAGTLSNGSLYRWSPDEGAAVLLGKPVATESYVNSLTVSDDGKIYGGTFPNAHVFEFDPAVQGGFADALTDFGPAEQGGSYARTVTWHADKVYVGVGTPAALVELDPADGTFRDVPLPSGIPAAEMIYGIESAGDLLTVRTEFPGHLMLFDPRTEEWDSIGVSAGLFASPASAEGMVYFRDEAGALASFDLNTKVVGQTSLTSLPNTRPMRWTQIQEPGYTGQTLVWFDSSGNLYHYNPATDTHKRQPTNVSRIPAAIHSLGVGGDGRVYSSAYVSGGLVSYDPATGTQHSFDGGLGQIDSYLVDGSSLWLGSYTKANLFELDTATGTGGASSPVQHFSLQYERQDRPMALAKVGERIVVGTVAEYGVNGGALTVYDPTTPDAEPEVYRDVIADHAVVALAADTLGDAGIVYAGTTVDGGLGSTPTSTQGMVFAFDTRTGQKLWEAEGAPGERAVTALTVSPTGTLWGIGVDTLFELDPRDGTLLRSKKLVEPAPANFVWMGSALEIGPDGHLYAFAGHQVMRVDPENLEVMPLVQDATAYTADMATGSLYFSRSADLYRADISDLLAGVTRSADATLTGVWLDGEPLPGFTASQHDYTVPVDIRAAVPAMRVVAADTGARVRIDRAGDVPGTTTITVTAADGQTEATYRIAFEIDEDSTVTNVTPPSITGTPKPGRVLTATPGDWDFAELEFTIQWLRDGVPLAPPVVAFGRAPRGETYTVTGRDLGTELTLAVTARVPGTDISATASSAPLPVPRPGRPGPPAP